MGTLRENLVYLMSDRKWNAYHLERVSGVPQPTTYRFLKGIHAEPKLETVLMWANAFGISESQLRGFDPLPGRDNNVMEPTGNFGVESKSIPSKAGSYSRIELSDAPRIPILSREQAKDWRLAVANYNPATDNGMMLISNIPFSQNSFLFEIKGDAMAPELPAGIHVLIDPDRYPAPENFVLVEIADDVVVRQFWREAGDELLKPINDKYPHKPFSEAKIIGVVTYKIPMPTRMI